MALLVLGVGFAGRAVAECPPAGADVDVAIGGRQPDRMGRYASDAEGVTTSVHID